MKKFVLSVFTLVFAVSFVVAQDNEIKLEQLSNNNTANVEQTSEGDLTILTQKAGSTNRATIQQLIPSSDPNNVGLPTSQYAKVDQIGSSNRFNLLSVGADNRVVAEQRGNNNNADINVRNFVSDGDRINLLQRGNTNNAKIRTEGNGTNVDADQLGNQNRIDYFANGGASGHKGVLLQNGNSNNMDIDQDGGFHLIRATQNGSSNRLNAAQTMGSNVINSLQRGNSNVANLNQNN
jgi:hypothetical protein